jgi:hypothetical protein
MSESLVVVRVKLLLLYNYSFVIQVL